MALTSAGPAHRDGAIGADDVVGLQRDDAVARRGWMTRLPPVTVTLPVPEWTAMMPTGPLTVPERSIRMLDAFVAC